MPLKKVTGFRTAICLIPHQCYQSCVAVSDTLTQGFLMKTRVTWKITFTNQLSLLVYFLRNAWLKAFPSMEGECISLKKSEKCELKWQKYEERPISPFCLSFPLVNQNSETIIWRKNENNSTLPTYSIRTLLKAQERGGRPGWSPMSLTHNWN